MQYIKKQWLTKLWDQSTYIEYFFCISHIVRSNCYFLQRPASFMLFACFSWFALNLWVTGRTVMLDLRNYYYYEQAPFCKAGGIWQYSQTPPNPFCWSCLQRPLLAQECYRAGSRNRNLRQLPDELMIFATIRSWRNPYDRLLRADSRTSMPAIRQSFSWLMRRSRRDQMVVLRKRFYSPS